MWRYAKTLLKFALQIGIIVILVFYINESLTYTNHVDKRQQVLEELYDKHFAADQHAVIPEGGAEISNRNDYRPIQDTIRYQTALKQKPSKPELSSSERFNANVLAQVSELKKKLNWTDIKGHALFVRKKYNPGEPEGVKIFEEPGQMDIVNKSPEKNYSSPHSSVMPDKQSNQSTEFTPPETEEVDGIEGASKTPTMLPGGENIDNYDVHGDHQWGDEDIAQEARPESMTSTRESLRTYNCSKGGNPYCLNGPIPTAMWPGRSCSGSTKVDLLLLITSSEGHADRRKAIRDTWANKQQSGFVVKRVFLFGKKGESLQREIEPENEEFGDILQGDFEDSYRNLTLKTIMGYTWMRENCPIAKYVMKTDDDMFINTVPLVKFAYKSIGENPIMAGYCDPPRPRIRVEPSHRWYMSRDQYPDDDDPAYCCGCGYIIAGRAAYDAADAMRWLPVLPLEDLFTGISITRLPYEVEVVPRNYRFITQFSGRILTEEEQCELLIEGKSLTIHEVAVEKIYEYHQNCHPAINGTDSF